jgi:hypothetical protein
MPSVVIRRTDFYLPLRRQDSNLDHRNQNPRCCLYTTADRPPILARTPCAAIGTVGTDGLGAALTRDARGAILIGLTALHEDVDHL